MKASEAGEAQAPKLLLSAGADVKVKTTWGWNALMIATEKGHTEIVKLLENHAAKKQDDRILQKHYSNLFSGPSSLSQYVSDAGAICPEPSRFFGSSSALAFIT
jgi:ankyrin repeat protein